MVALRGAVRSRILWAACFAPLALGCRPNISGRPSLVDRPLVLAVSSSPAERAPRDNIPVAYTALYASPRGDADPSGIEWAYCMIRKPISVIGPAALDCYQPGGKGLIQLGKGPTVQGTLDKEDCSNFGPSPTPPKGDEPPSRAADPDITGGYYQPVRLLVPTLEEPEYVVGVTRLDCGISGATIDQSLEFADRYRPNENPVIDEIVVTHSGGREENFKTADGMPMVKVRPGETVTLRTNWADCPTKSMCGDGICGPGEYAAEHNVNGEKVPGCPEDCETPKGCTGSEPYVALDPDVRAIVDHSEGMRLSWFASDGSFLHDRTGVTENDADRTHTENDWTAPASIGSTHMWLVLRDDRGGVGWTELEIDVQP